MAVPDKTLLPIIISGTGPAALLLAHVLLRATPPLPFRMYERDLSMTHRAQGYRFKVTGRGVKSCRDVLDPEHFELLRATCADNQAVPMKRVDALTGALLPAPGTPPHRHMEEEPLTVDRTLMRQVLFKGLEGHITFGKEVVGYEDAAADNDSAPVSDESCASNGNKDGPGVLVHIADGSTVRGALLVGADGAFSRVRARLAPQVRLLDSELQMVFGKTPLTPAFHAALSASGHHDDLRAADLLKGLTLVADPSPQESPMFFMFEPMRFGRRGAAAAADPVLAASVPRDYVYWALALRSDRREARGRDWRTMDGPAAADLAEELTSSWLPSLRALVTHQDRTQTTPLRSAVTPLPLPDWRAPAGADGSNASKPPPNLPDRQSAPALGPMVTLIGDAAHAMPPTGALGATTALTDAAVLGGALAAHGVSRRALAAYEAEMRDYAGRAIEASLLGGKKFVNMRDMGEMRPMEQ